MADLTKDKNEFQTKELCTLKLAKAPLNLKKKTFLIGKEHLKFHTHEDSPCCRENFPKKVEDLSKKSSSLVTGSK